MADLITTKAAFPKSGGLAVANGAVSVNAGNGLHVNPTTGMVEVPVDTTAGLGYGSNGLEVEVDDSTIGFNASGQLQALGGGGGASLQRIDLTSASSTQTVCNWKFSTAANACGYYIYALMQDKWLYLLGMAMITAVSYPLFYVEPTTKNTYYLNGTNITTLTTDSIFLGASPTQPVKNEPTTVTIYGRKASTSSSDKRYAINVTQYSSDKYGKTTVVPLNQTLTYV